MDLEITPEPSQAEWRAIVDALAQDRTLSDEPSPWWRAGVEPDAEDEL